MKITRNEKDGKFIVDFEGLEISVESGGNVSFISDLFNDDVVSKIINGVWKFNSPKSQETKDEGRSMDIWVFKVEVNSRGGGPNPWCIEDVYVIAKTKEAAERKIKKNYHNTHGIIKSFVERIYAL